MLLFLSGKYIGNGQFDQHDIQFANFQHFMLKKNTVYCVIYIETTTKKKQYHILNVTQGGDVILPIVFDENLFIRKLFRRMEFYMKEKQSIYIPFTYINHDVAMLETKEAKLLLLETIKPIDSNTVIFNWVNNISLLLDNYEHDDHITKHVFPNNTTNKKYNKLLQCDSFIQSKKKELPVNMYFPPRDFSLDLFKNKITLVDHVDQSDTRFVHLNVKKSTKGDGTLPYLLKLETHSILRLHILLKSRLDIRWIGEGLRVAKKVTVSNYKPFL